MTKLCELGKIWYS